MSQAAVQLLGGGDANDVRVGVLDGVQDFLYIYLDLDVCVPQWMRVSGGINIVHVPSSISLKPPQLDSSHSCFLLIILACLGQFCKRHVSDCRTEM